jgi:hypothetical protein
MYRIYINLHWSVAMLPSVEFSGTRLPTTYEALLRAVLEQMLAVGRVHVLPRSRSEGQRGAADALIAFVRNPSLGHCGGGCCGMQVATVLVVGGSVM